MKSFTNGKVNQNITKKLAQKSNHYILKVQEKNFCNTTIHVNSVLPLGRGLVPAKLS